MASDAAASGRLRLDGRNPVGGAYVFALSTEDGRVLGFARTFDASLGPELGAWRIEGLPGGEAIELLAFLPTNTNLWGASVVTLAPGDNANLPLDVGSVERGPPTAPSLLGLFLEIGREANAVLVEGMIRDFAAQAMSLVQSGAAEEEEEEEEEPEPESGQGGGGEFDSGVGPGV